MIQKIFLPTQNRLYDTKDFHSTVIPRIISGVKGRYLPQLSPGSDAVKVINHLGDEVVKVFRVE